MILSKFKIPLYNVYVTYVIIESSKDYNDLAKVVKSIRLDKEQSDRCLEIVKRDCVNGGDTIRQLNYRKIFCIIYRCTSDTIRKDIICHEKRHIEDRILEYFHVNDIESAGLLAGFLGLKMLNYKK